MNPLAVTDVRHFVHPDTTVYTDCGPKRIRDLSTLDRVYCQAEKFVRVRRLLVESKFSGQLIGIDGMHVAASHRLLVQDGIDVVYKSADELTVGEHIVSFLADMPAQCHTHDIEEMTEEDCLLYGFLFATFDSDVLQTPEKVNLTWKQRTGTDVPWVCASEKAGHSQPAPGCWPRVFMGADGERAITRPMLKLPTQKCDAIRRGILAAGPIKCSAYSKSQTHDLRYLWLRTGRCLESNGDTWNERPLRGPATLHLVKNLTTSCYEGALYDVDTEGVAEAERSYTTELGISHNGGGKRNGSFAIYLEPWHADIYDFLDLKKNHGDEERRARDLFYALWTPDLFYERVKNDGKWSLMDPHDCTGLTDAVGSEFKTLYERYESQGLFKKQVDARDLFKHILVSQVETGTPYLLNKDAANRKSNQSNLGTIRSSNLCAEIIEYSDADQHAVCNLASLCLPTYVDLSLAGKFDFQKLHDVAKVVTRNLNKVIDVNMYPTKQAETSNMLHRPVGIGVQGLADVFAILKLPFESLEARQLNIDISETIYHAALEASCQLAATREAQIEEYKRLQEGEQKETESPRSAKKTDTVAGKAFSREELSRTSCAGAYDSYLWNGGCPVSRGILQFDMWDVTPSDRWDWARLRQDIAKHGIRNSLLVAYMPTASTSQIMGNMESFEPFTANAYSRRTIAGTFVIVNKYLVRDLIERGLWNEEIKQQIQARDGSVQHIPGIPDDLKAVYKTVWEIKQKSLIDMSADRGAFCCQSQSLNLYVDDPTPRALMKMHMYSWADGGPRSLPTAQYYLRARAKARMQQVTVDPSISSEKRSEPVFPADTSAAAPACRRDNPECMACSA